MLTIDKDRLLKSIQAVGVRPGDGLLVHSAIQFLGQPTGGMCTYLETLQELLGPHGTLAVPAFNFGFARGEPFDPQTTPAVGMGVFSEYVRQQRDARRTPHPMQSLAVMGYHADDLAQRDTPSAFDPGSAFDRMLDLGFKVLLLGADIDAISMLHYCEQRASVPYRYWKDFRGLVRNGAKWEIRTYRMFVRDLEADPRLSLAPVKTLLQARDQWYSLPVNYGHIALCQLRHFVAAVDHFLRDDPWSLLTNREHVLAHYQGTHPDR